MRESSAAAEMSSLHQLFWLQPCCTDAGYERLKGKTAPQLFISVGTDKAAEMDLEHVRGLLPTCEVYSWLPAVWDVPPP